MPFGPDGRRRPRTEAERRLALACHARGETARATAARLGPGFDERTVHRLWSRGPDVGQHPRAFRGADNRARLIPLLGQGVHPAKAARMIGISRVRASQIARELVAAGIVTRGGVRGPYAVNAAVWGRGDDD